MVDPGTAGAAGRGVWAVIRGFIIGKRTYDRRSWLKYIRREPIVRTLAFDRVANEEVAEAADTIIELLSETPIPNEPKAGLLTTTGRLTREWITHGVRYPQYLGRWGPTFYRRLIEWILVAVDSEAGKRALDRAGYPTGQDRIRAFAYTVRHETSYILVEDARGRGGGQDDARREMASAVEGAQQVEQVRSWVPRLIKLGKAFALGIVTGLTSDLLFTEDSEKALAVGALTFGGTLAAEFAPSLAAALSSDVLAVREGARKWLRRLPGILQRYLQWDDRASARPARGAKMSLADILAAIGRGGATFTSLSDTGISASLSRLIQRAGDVGDPDLRALLIMIENSLDLEPGEEPADLSAALIDLMVFLDEEQGEGGVDDVSAVERRSVVRNLERPPPPEIGPGSSEEAD